MRIVARNLKDDAGRVTWDDLFPPTNIRVQVNANNGEPVASVLHELLHVVMQPLVWGFIDETLEEAVILALEQYMMLYVRKSPARLKLWSDTIQRKIDSETEEKSLEDLIDRT